MRFRTLAFGIVSASAIFIAGCGGGSSSGPGGPKAPTGKTLPFTTVAGMKTGSTFYLILDRPKGKITWPVTLAGTSVESGAHQIMFSIVNQPLGAGDAGSLIIDKDGNAVAALDTTLSAASANVFTATSIEDEIDILLSGPVQKKPATTTANANDGLRHIVQGVSQHLWSIMSKDPNNQIPKYFTLDTTTSPKYGKAVLKPAPFQTGFASYSSSICVMSSYGDAVTSFTLGSETMPYLGKLLGFGHSLNWEGGSLNMPVFYGQVLSFVNDPVVGGTKVAVPNMSASAGALVDDRRFGIVIDPNTKPVPIPVTGTVTMNTNPAVTFNGFVAQDPNLATNFVLTNVAQGVSNIVDASDIAGSATGSATITFPDGTTQTVDLTDSGSTALISDLYFILEQALLNTNTGQELQVSGITFTFTITTA